MKATKGLSNALSMAMNPKAQSSMPSAPSAPMPKMQEQEETGGLQQAMDLMQQAMDIIGGLLGDEQSETEDTEYE